MNLYIFGHSICRRRRAKDRTDPLFVDIMFEKYNIPDSCLIQSPVCSEERILYFLKKSPKIDIAIIFHGKPSSIFVPALDRDFDYDSIGNTWKDDRERTDYYVNRITDSSITNIEKIPRFQFRNAYDEHVKYFYTRDLQRNRFLGALLQIDQYLTYKQIPVIHCPFKNTIPEWFKFSSGIVDNELANLQDYSIGENDSWNRVSNKNNIYIAEKLSEYISNGATGGI